MVLIKQQPEDFVVTEVTLVEKKENGKYSYFWLKKRGMNTLHATHIVARALGVKKVGFAGSKDKHAITVQLCSAEAGKRKIEEAVLNDMELTFYGSGDEPISLGDLKGNMFDILIRDCEFKLPLGDFTVNNYFGEQRFSAHNVVIGRALVKKDFNYATALVAKGNGFYNEEVRFFLQKEPTNFIGALRLIPKKIMSIFVHAYQSWIWNEAVAQLSEGKQVDYSEGTYVFGKCTVQSVPLVGFGTTLSNDSHYIILKKILEKEGITPRDFIIREIPELSVEGDERLTHITVKDFKWKQEERNIRVQFFLPKGSYATVVLASLFNERFH
jgi:tRNA pseudouridine13 synthase